MRFLFDDYVLDTERCELRRGSTLLGMEPQVFDLLAFLVRNRDRVVSKEDLLASVWGGRIVSESTIASRINAARRIVGDSGGRQRLIRTIIGKGVRFVGEVREQQDADLAAMPSVAPRLSIVVLPFTNFSDLPELEHFANGITDDLTTDLSRTSGGFVIARNTAFTFKGKPVDVKKIGRELGTRYVVEGSVRRAGDLLRLNVQLTDAESGAHLWADRFDTDLVDFAEAQSETTGRIARAINLELVEAAGLRIERERALDPALAYHNNLPQLANALIGRERNLAEIEAHGLPSYRRRRCECGRPDAPGGPPVVGGLGGGGGSRMKGQRH